MIGKEMVRVDAYEKATGKAVYMRDLLSRYSRALIVRAKRSPYAHARIKKLDVSAARKLPGVVFILTGSNAGTDWSRFVPHCIIPEKEVLFAGQAVAMVAAEDAESAQAALGAIEVEYEPLPHVLTWQESFRPDPASVVDPKLPIHRNEDAMHFPYPNVAGEYELTKGDADRAFEEGFVKAEGTFWAEKKVHNQLEKAAALTVAETDGSYTVWCNGCGIHGVIKKALVAAFPEIGASRIRVRNPYTGGSFGNRNVPYVEMLSLLMAVRTGRTVYYELSREEMFTAAPSNWICATDVRLSADKDGYLTSKSIRLIEEIGASVGNVGYTGRLSGSSTATEYRVENVRFSGCSLLTNTTPTGPYRGLGTPDAVFGLELLMNDLAHQLGMSPLEFRLRNLIRRGDSDDFGEVITSTGLGQCLEKAAAGVEFDVPSVQDGSDWIRGKGIACCGKQNGPNGRSEAEVWLFQDMSVQIRVSCDNHGMGVTTTLVQLAAEELKLPAENFRVIIGDTQNTPFDNFSASSSGLYRTGNAVLLACREVIEKLREDAARKAGIPVSLVEYDGERMLLKGAADPYIPTRKLFEPANMFRQDVWGIKEGSPVTGHGIFCPQQALPWGEDGQTRRMWNWFQYAATAVEIAVNRKTGQIKVLRIANAGDSGNPINPKIVEAQLEGAAHMAIGFSVNEQVLRDDHGKVINGNLSDYRLPMILDMPKNENVHAYICPDPLPDGPFGAKGMSESVVSAVPAAIAGALYDALGVRVDHFPMTAETVLALIEEKEGKHES